LYGLGVQGVKVLILLGALFLPSVAPPSQQDLCFMKFMLFASALLLLSWTPLYPALLLNELISSLFKIIFNI
jgi:hypothetical protein